MGTFHIPVMLKETVDYLNVAQGEWYVDCNLGGGGHTAEILKRGGSVIGIDLDQDALYEVAKKYNLTLHEADGKLYGESENLILVQNNFINIQKIVSGKSISGVLFDLGLSSHQLDTPERGFSFQVDAPLDMRMDSSTNAAQAADLINGLHEKELAELFWKLGDESFSRVIAKKIVDERKKQLITSTLQLARIVEMVKHREGHIHPATKVFQALRIAVNDELHNLQDALPKAFNILESGGRLVVISFHSLEDRIVKDFMRDIEDFGKGKILIKKPLEPSDEEIGKNSRARSAKVRVLEKTNGN